MIELTEHIYNCRSALLMHLVGGSSFSHSCFVHPPRDIVKSKQNNHFEGILKLVKQVPVPYHYLKIIIINTSTKWQSSHSLQVSWSTWSQNVAATVKMLNDLNIIWVNLVKNDPVQSLVPSVPSENFAFPQCKIFKKRRCICPLEVTTIITEDNLF